jgi:hypothetical protein
MSTVRGFSNEGFVPPNRDVEDAPLPMRQELLNALYVSAKTHAFGQFNMNVDDELYFSVSQALGVEAAGNPAAGRRQRMGRDLANVADWRRVYDLIQLLWPEFVRFGREVPFRENVNQILAAYHIAWDLGDDGRFHRVLPINAQAQVAAAFQELTRPGFAAALQLANQGRDAYDARPRRGRSACTDMFDAMESTARIRIPGERMYAVLQIARRNSLLPVPIISTLEQLNTLRNQEFGHGNLRPFTLTDPQVDFVYLGCVAGVLLFARMP